MIGRRKGRKDNLPVKELYKVWSLIQGEYLKLLDGLITVTRSQALFLLKIVIQVYLVQLVQNSDRGINL